MEVTSNALQNVADGANVIFTATPVSCPCGSITNRADSGLLTLRGGARYKCTFGGNIGLPSGGSAGEISLSMALDGEPVPTSAMKHTAADGEVYNVCRAMYITIPRGCCYTLSVQNTSGQDIEVQNANLIVERAV